MNGSGFYYLLNVWIILIAGTLAILPAYRWGGPNRNRAAIVAVAAYSVLAGLDLTLLPFMLWSQAHSDNSFLGVGALGQQIAALGGVMIFTLGRRPPWQPAVMWMAATSISLFLPVIGFIGLVIVGGYFLRRSRDPEELALLSRAIALAFGGAVVAALFLALRGPTQWQSSSGRFGTDVILMTVLVGVAVFAMGRSRAGVQDHPRPSS